MLTFTSHPKIRDLATLTDDETTDASIVDPALLHPTDVDLSGGNRVVAKSIEGEDDLVDVSMQDATQDRPANQDDNEYVTDSNDSSPGRMHWICG